MNKKHLISLSARSSPKNVNTSRTGQVGRLSTLY